MKVLYACFFAAMLVLTVIPSSEAQCPSVFETVQANSNLSTLETAIVASRLTDFFNDSSKNITVFAPDNAALGRFITLLSNEGLSLNNVTTAENNKAASIVLYHVVPQVYRSTQLTDDLKLDTFTPGKQQLTIERNATNVEVEGEGEDDDATVITPDVQACNSIVHVIDNVLLPNEKLNDIVPYTDPAAPAPGTPPTPPGTFAPPPPPPPPPTDGNSASKVGSTMLLGAAAAAVATALSFV